MREATRAVRAPSRSPLFSSACLRMASLAALQLAFDSAVVPMLAWSAWNSAVPSARVGPAPEASMTYALGTGEAPAALLPLKRRLSVAVSV